MTSDFNSPRGDELHAGMHPADGSFILLTEYEEMKLPPIQRLSNELLRLILDQIEPDPEKTVPIDRRQFLSVESFDRPLDSTRGSVKDVGRFRCACRRFADVGAPLLFTKVSARFSFHSLQKLDTLASWPHLARHVKVFTYLVPYFYRGGGEIRLLLPGAGDAFITFDLSSFRRKAEEQRRLVLSNEDVCVLERAFASFTSLQFVKLLRLVDEEDSALARYLRQHEDVRQVVDLDWAPACSRASRTIGTALLHSNVPWSRFSSPTLSPQSAEFLASNKPQSLSTLSARLTCLTLHFEDGSDLDQKMSELSNLFRTVFTTAVSMQAVHLGFPSLRPVSLPLEEVFHNVTWDKLVAFGVQGWKLDAEEIISFALRHKDRLKGLRLREVLLKDGSMWKDVLGALRDSMRRLEWVSLRRINYARHFDSERLGAGTEVPDEPPPGDSDSEESEHENDPMVGSSTYHNNTNGSFESDEEESGSDADSDDERGRGAHDMDFPPLNSPSTPASAPWCNCNGRGHLETAEDLGDDGYAVTWSQWKAWEKWVVKRCPEHNER